jgi:hypothetical protein
MEEHINDKIMTPVAAHKALGLLDFKKLAKTGLNARLIYYIEGAGNRDKVARYIGVPQISGVTPNLSLSLPGPYYQGESESLLPAGRLEFYLDAFGQEGYDMLAGVRDVILPALFARGYDKVNQKHESVMWFQLYKGNGSGDLRGSEIMCVNSIAGLRVYKRDVEGSKVISDKTLLELMELKPRDRSTIKMAAVDPPGTTEPTLK